MTSHRTIFHALRRELRVLRLAVLVQGIGMVAWICMGTSPVRHQDDVLRAERFEIIDPASGKVTIAIGADNNGRPSIRLSQANGCPAATLTARTEGGRMTLFNADSVRSIDVAATPDGGLIGIRDCDGLRLTMGTNGDGGVALALICADELAVQLSGELDGGQISLLRNGENAIVASTNSVGGHLMVYSDTGKPVVCLERHRQHPRGAVYLYGEDDQKAGCFTLDEESRPISTILSRKAK